MLQHHCYPKSYWNLQCHIRLRDSTISPVVDLEITNDPEKEAVDLSRLCHRFSVSKPVYGCFISDSHSSLFFLSD